MRRQGRWGAQVGVRRRGHAGARAGARRASVLGRAGRQALAGARARASGSWEQAQAGGKVLGARQGAGCPAGRR